MCGLAGEITFKEKPDSATVKRMLNTLSSRGPDAEGLFLQDNICLGHRRLKIIDLSNHASQPMIDSSLGLTIIFNGCIYNYKLLKKTLTDVGYQFFSNSDTEVILKAYHYWREACVEQFNGMFSFVIVERDTGEVFIARDRLGIKPLYYFHNHQRFCFASSLPALLNHPEVPTDIDPVSLNHYFGIRAIVQDRTLFNGIKKLAPGCWIKLFTNGELKHHRYWQLQPTTESERNDFNQRQKQFKDFSEQQWIDALQKALMDSARRRLEADVPVGVLLSGGLDSSLIVALLDKLGQKSIHTFSIGFEQVGEEEGNEFRYSDIIADKFNTRHNKIFAKHDTLLESLPDCVSAMSEPMVSHDVIGFYLLSQKVSEHVKVVQSGQGADEVFGGYHWYPPMVDVSPKQAAETYADAYFSYDFNDYKKLVQKQWSDEDHSLSLVDNYFKKGFAQNPDIGAIDHTLMMDTEIMLVDDPVKRVDNMTMAFGLEARVPFLDHELVELASHIPYPLKLKDGGKYLLKQVARRMIPHEVIDRPKGYFPVPALRNMQGPYLDMAKQVFSQQVARERGLFNFETIEQMLQTPGDFRGPFGSKLWQVTLLELWLQQQLNVR